MTKLLKGHGYWLDPYGDFIPVPEFGHVQIANKMLNLGLDPDNDTKEIYIAMEKKGYVRVFIDRLTVPILALCGRKINSVQKEAAILQGIDHEWIVSYDPTPAWKASYRDPDILYRPPMSEAQVVNELLNL